jgi:hypothetical protein
MTKKIVLTALTALALTGGAAEAQAFDWYETKTKTVRVHVRGENCSTPDHHDVWAPYGARNLEAVSPLPGQQLGVAWDSYDGYGPLQVTNVEDVGNALEFSMMPTGDWCWDNDDLDPAVADEFASGWDEEYDEYEAEEWWESDPVKLSIRYQLRKRRAMTRGLARNLASEVLYRRFAYMESTYANSYRCRVSGHRGRCETGFIIGDVVFNGVVVSRLVGRKGQKPLWSYRLKGVQLDEFCRFVSHAGDCTTRIKKQRSRVSLPYWVRAKTV